MFNSRLLELRSGLVDPHRITTIPPTVNNDDTTILIKNNIKQLSNLIVNLKKSDNPTIYLKDINELINKIKYDMNKLSKSDISRTLLSQFVTQLELYNNIQLELERKSRERLSRTLQIILPQHKVENIEEFVDSEKVQELIQNEILQKNNAISSLLLLEEQNKDLEQLEKNINILHEMFIDVDCMLKSQGDTLQNITGNLQETKYKIHSGLNKLNEANKLKKKRREQWFVIIGSITGITLVIVAVTLAPLLAFA